MKSVLTLSIALLVASAPACSSSQTWTGTISDEMCAANHFWDEHAAPRTDAECTAACIHVGLKYVLVAGDQVLPIANRDDLDLPKYAGRIVQLTGQMKNNVMTVSTIAPQAAQ